jgi:hypothetical protein
VGPDIRSGRTNQIEGRLRVGSLAEAPPGDAPVTVMIIAA